MSTGIVVFLCLVSAVVAFLTGLAIGDALCSSERARKDLKDRVAALEKQSATLRSDGGEA